MGSGQRVALLTNEGAFIKREARRVVATIGTLTFVQSGQEFRVRKPRDGDQPSIGEEPFAIRAGTGSGVDLDHELRHLKTERKEERRGRSHKDLSYCYGTGAYRN